MDGLSPLDDPSTCMDRLSAIDGNVMIVGHLPRLNKLASGLLCGEQEKMRVQFEKCSVLCLRRGQRGEWGI